MKKQKNNRLFEKYRKNCSEQSKQYTYVTDTIF